MDLPANSPNLPPPDTPPHPYAIVEEEPNIHLPDAIPPPPDTPIAEQDPVSMAEAMKNAVMAGRRAFKAGRMKKRKYASASSPEDYLI